MMTAGAPLHNNKSSVMYVQCEKLFLWWHREIVWLHIVLSSP